MTRQLAELAMVCKPFTRQIGVRFPVELLARSKEQPFCLEKFYAGRNQDRGLIRSSLILPEVYSRKKWCG